MSAWSISSLDITDIFRQPTTTYGSVILSFIQFIICVQNYWLSPLQAFFKAGKNYKNKVTITNATIEADLKAVPLDCFSSFFSVASFKKLYDVRLRENLYEWDVHLFYCFKTDHVMYPRRTFRRKKTWPSFKPEKMNVIDVAWLISRSHAMRRISCYEASIMVYLSSMNRFCCHTKFLK